MIQHIWSVACSHSSIDTETNNVSLLNVVEQINPVGLAADAKGILPMQIEIVSLWMRDGVPGRGFARMVIEAPDSVLEPTDEMMIDLSPEATTRFRSRLRLAGVPFEGYGIYWFRVEYREGPGEEWVEVARLPIEMKASDN